MNEIYDDLEELPARPGKTIPADDRELLELAARAIGAVRVEDVEGEEWLILHFEDGTKTHGWNPLLFYGDTFELAVRLEMDFTPSEGAVSAMDDFTYVSQDIGEVGGNRLAATSRAIVRVAAEIGKQRA